MQQVDISELYSCLSAQLARAWDNVVINPRSCPSEGARLCAYLRWYGSPAQNRVDLLRLSLPRNYKAIVRFLRSRTGCHALPNVAGAWDRVPRSQRLCTLCQSPYSDERHAFLECPALTHLRQQHQQLYCAHGSMRQSLWQSDMLQLVRLFTECLDSFASAQ